MSCRKKCGKCGDCAENALRAANGDGNGDDGNRGPRGFRGVPGPTGPCCTGPTGATGAQGPTGAGVTGAGEAPDFAFLTNQVYGLPLVLPANWEYTGPPNNAFGDVNFSVLHPCVRGIVRIPSPVPPVGQGVGTIALQIRKTACYEFGFSIRGVNLEQARSLLFELRQNGVGVVGSLFKSMRPAPPINPLNPLTGEQVIITGQGIVPLNAGDIVTLRNVTGIFAQPGFGDDVALGGGDTGYGQLFDIDTSVNASLYLIMIPPSGAIPGP